VWDSIWDGTHFAGSDALDEGCSVRRLTTAKKNKKKVRNTLQIVVDHWMPFSEFSSDQITALYFVFRFFFFLSPSSF